ncbi:60S ribosomal protein L35a-1 [Citrus sinensis]|uniref:60S ribosomal protein L35a-1 n=1 Tax=Citrus sinensis TaxID=2711 RepID=A0ACB8MXK8_CITSI|nr:60S ribosomal protein L35a-1 [Citrus sinensis]
MVKGHQGEGVRSKSNQYPNTSLIHIEGVNTKEEVSWYCGKQWIALLLHLGQVPRPHGNSGVVRAKFKSNLPPKSMGDRVRVVMYPGNI